MSKKTSERAIFNALRTRYLFYTTSLCTVIILLGGIFALLLALAIALSAVTHRRIPFISSLWASLYLLFLPLR